MRHLGTAFNGAAARLTHSLRTQLATRQFGPHYILYALWDVGWDGMDASRYCPKLGDECLRGDISV